MNILLKRFFSLPVIISTLTIVCCKSTPIVQAEDTELSLPVKQAFAIGTETLVKSVKSLDTKAFNQELLKAHQNGEEWSNSLVEVGLKFMGGSENQPRLNISLVIPGEWEPGIPFPYARVTLERGGWLDDSVGGDRYVLWIVQGTKGEFKVQRALYANLCYRPSSMYSADPCL